MSNTHSLRPLNKTEKSFQCVMGISQRAATNQNQQSKTSNQKPAIKNQQSIISNHIYIQMLISPSIVKPFQGFC